MRAAPLAALAVVLAACTAGGGSRTSHVAPRPTPTVIYAALGASETVGIGTEDPGTEAFPLQLLPRLGVGTVMYDFGIPSETTQAALQDELPAALAVHPTLATVFFNVDDLVAGVTPADFQAHLDELVGGLRRGGVARVLVANTAHLDRLPAYFACRPNPPAGAPRCPLGSTVLPPPDQLNAIVAAYNTAIAQVVQQEHATLVDLFAAGEVPDLHPDYVSADGFHPSARGAAAIAAAFAAADSRAPS